MIEYENLSFVNKEFRVELQKSFNASLDSGKFILSRNVEKFENNFSAKLKTTEFEGNLKNIYLNLNSKMDVRFSVPNAVDTSNLSLNKEVDLTFSSSKAVVLPSGPLAVD